jgi:WD40 repeat protein
VFAFELSGSDPADFRSPGAGLGTPVWSPDGTRLAVPDETGGQTRLLDTTTGKPVITLKASATGRFLRTSAPAAFSPDGRRLVCHVPTRSGADVLSVLDTGSGKELLTLPLPGRANGLGFAPLAFSADGYRLHRFTTERKLEGSFGQGRPAWQESILVTTWDATPRPEPKER